MPRARARQKEPHYSTKRAGEMLGLSPITLYKRRAAGLAPHGWIKDGRGRILYPESSLVAFGMERGEPPRKATG